MHNASTSLNLYIYEIKQSNFICQNICALNGIFCKQEAGYGRPASIEKPASPADIA